MGRIAAALKRAQQERALRRDQDGNDVGDASSSAPVQATVEETDWLVGGPTGRTMGETAPQTERDVLGQASILDRPPLSDSSLRAVHGAGEEGTNQPAVITQGAVETRIVALHDPDGQIAEKYRSLRTRLLTANAAGSARLLAITSSLPKEGKTTTVANLGFSLAELRHLRVAMIDLDFRQRGLEECFQVRGKPGIAEVLRGERRLDEVCLRVVRENLYLIPAGELGDSQPSELLVGPQVRRVARELSERFHYSLLDVPPVDSAADVGLIGPLCHAALLVVRMHRTPEPVLRRCAKLLQANKVALTGCILTGYEETAAALDAHDDYEPGS